MLVHQFEEMLDLHHRRFHDDVLDERDQPGFRDFVIEKWNDVRIGLADNVMVDIVQAG